MNQLAQQYFIYRGTLTVKHKHQSLQQPKQPTLIESYNFSHNYIAQPLINGGPTPQSYLGSGFASVGIDKPGQTINIADNFDRSVGTYTIGSVNDKIALNATQLNKVNIVEYDYDLGSAPVVTNQNEAIHPIHF
jgi:hypothetical protein